MFNKIIAGVVALGVMAPAVAFAQTPTTTSANVQAILAQIQALETQIAALRAQHKALMEQQSTALQTLVQTMKEGSTGDQVAVLQALLALDPSIYPEGTVSGYFGRLTAEAVKRYQRKHGIDSLGVVGPKTLKKLNEDLDDDDDDDDDHDDRGKGKGKEKVVICHKGQTLTVAKPAAVGHIRHGDKRGACEGGGTATTTPPTADTVAPVISNSLVSSITANGANVSWITNENANGKVYYATTSPAFGSSMTASHATYMTGHSLLLTGLTASTTYYYALESKDAAGNTATTSTASFNTL